MVALPLVLLAVAKVGTMTVPDLAANSPVIVVGDVKSVFDASGIKLASVVVEKVIKGKAVPARLRFIASPTWTCDVSDAEVGEHVLLYLSDPIKGSPILAAAAALSERQAEPLYQLSHSGRGRIVLEARGDKQIATVNRSEPDERWELVVNLVLPERTPVQLRSANLGYVSLQTLLSLSSKRTPPDPGS